MQLRLTPDLALRVQLYEPDSQNEDRAFMEGGQTYRTNNGKPQGLAGAHIH